MFGNNNKNASTPQADICLNWQRKFKMKRIKLPTIYLSCEFIQLKGGQSFESYNYACHVYVYVKGSLFFGKIEVWSDLAFKGRP